MFEINMTKRLSERVKEIGKVVCLTRIEHEEKCALYCNEINFLLSRATLTDEDRREWNRLQRKMSDWHTKTFYPGEFVDTSTDAQKSNSGAHTGVASHGKLPGGGYSPEGDGPVGEITPPGKEVKPGEVRLQTVEEVQRKALGLPPGTPLKPESGGPYSMPTDAEKPHSSGVWLEQELAEGLDRVCVSSSECECGTCPQCAADLNAASAESEHVPPSVDLPVICPNCRRYFHSKYDVAAIKNKGSCPFCNGEANEG